MFIVSFFVSTLHLGYRLLGGGGSFSLLETLQTVLWLEGMQQKMKANNKYNFLPIRLCFINIYTYPNPKPTPYNNVKTLIIVVGLQCDKSNAI